jgi:hypothetical protein
MPIFLVAQKTFQDIIKEQSYELGGIIQNTDKAVFMNCKGRYSLTDIFGVNKEFVLEAIKLNKFIFYDNKLMVNNEPINTHYFYNNVPELVYFKDGQIQKSTSDGYSF